MSTNFRLNAPQLSPILAHLVKCPGNPQYNSFILTGNLFGGTLFLEQLRRNWLKKYPAREVLHLQGYAIEEFLDKTPPEMLLNFPHLHPMLLSVVLTDLRPENLSVPQREKLALFLKNLTKQNIQVAAATDVSDKALLTPELWSWYQSGREFSLSDTTVTYTKDLTASLTLEQDRRRFKFLSFLTGNTHHFGQLYPGILCKDDNLVFADTMTIELGLCWRGRFNPPASIFPRATCPCCGKVKLIPYCCIGSMLSGGHIIKFYCLNCRERLATNEALDYFRMMRTYGTRIQYLPHYRQTP